MVRSGRWRLIPWCAVAAAGRAPSGRLPALLVVVFLLLGVALEARAETLLQVYRLGVKNDPTLRAADADRRAVIESKNQNLAVLLPSIFVDADTQRIHQDTESNNVLNSNETFDKTGAALTVTQPVYRKDRFLRYKQADSRIAAAQARYLSAEQDLIIRVVERYTDVLAAIDNLEFVRAEKAAVRRQLDQATQRFEVGLIAVTDVHDAQASFDLAVADEIRAENLLDNAYNALVEITGVGVGEAPFIFKEVPLIRPDPEDIDEWVDTALRQNYLLEASRATTRTAREEVQVQRSDHYPTLDLVARADYDKTEGGSFGDRTVKENSISLQLSVPLYQGGLIRSRVREAVDRFEQAREQEEQQRRAVVRQTRDAYLGVRSSISRVKALAQRLVSAESRLEATEAGYEVGSRTIVDVLDAQGDRLESRRDLSRERYDYILNSLRLKQAAGTLSEEDVRRVDAWLR